MFCLPKTAWPPTSDGLAMSMISLEGQYAKIPYYYYLLVIMVLSIITTYFIRHSKFGLALRAISQDETKAEVAGIPTRQYKILAFGISGLFIGMAGAIWGSYLTYLRPSIFLPVNIGTTIVLMAILGGKGTVSGPVLGAAIMIAVNEFVVAKLGATELNIVVTGLILIFVLLFKPLAARLVKCTTTTTAVPHLLLEPHPCAIGYVVVCRPQPVLHQRQHHVVNVQPLLATQSPLMDSTPQCSTLLQPAPNHTVPAFAAKKSVMWLEALDSPSNLN